MRRKRWFLIVAVLATALIFLAAVFWWRWSLLPASSQELAPSKIFVVQKEESLSSIAARLKKEGLIRDSFAFKIFILTKNLSGKIQAGDFQIRPSLTPEEIAYLLTHGSLDVWLTFPEGWRREEFANRLAANLENFDAQEFLDLTKDLEGKLFPDTYLIPKETTPAVVLRIFRGNFEKRFSSELEVEAKSKGLTQSQVLVLASLVEREVRSDSDRPIVAGILLKRWHENWPLQVDATVQYVVASKVLTLIESADPLNDVEWWPKNLTKADLEMDSPYNTYKYKGLPPGPICNPGLASIKAVIYPKGTDYWFYLSDFQGQMHYAETAEEHNQNIAQFLGK